MRLDRIRVGRLVREEVVMKVVELKNKNIKLVADRGKMIQSKAMHYDEELGQDVADISGEVIYLGKNDRQENYVEVEKETEEI